MSESEMDKVVRDLERKNEARVSSTVDLAVKVLKVITDNMNAPEHQAFYRLLLQRPEIEQYYVRTIR